MFVSRLIRWRLHIPVIHAVITLTRCENAKKEPWFHRANCFHLLKIVSIFFRRIFPDYLIPLLLYPPYLPTTPEGPIISRLSPKGSCQIHFQGSRQIFFEYCSFLPFEALPFSLPKDNWDEKLANISQLPSTHGSIPRLPPLFANYPWGANYLHPRAGSRGIRVVWGYFVESQHIS